jgi:uncharacterized protein
MINRQITRYLQRSAMQYPVVTVTGPRQSGKSTLCKTLFPGKPYVNLEAPDTLQFASEDPRGFLASLRDGAIIDEFQRLPQLTSYLQVMVDEQPRPGQFILAGSHQFLMMRQVAQSLAGRTALFSLLPFSLAELQTLKPRAEKLALEAIIFPGFYPRIHDKRLDPSQALGDYFSTYVLRDIRELTAVHDVDRFTRFVRLCAGRVGQLLNLQSLGNDAGVSQPTARAWLDLLQTSGIVYLLAPWFVNTSRRLIKSPKLYFCDTGLACWLLGLRSADQVGRDPLYGSLFENLVVIEALKDQLNHGSANPLHFYRDSSGQEVDLLISQGPDLAAFEIKAGQTVNPDYFKGLRSFKTTYPQTVASGGVIYGGDQGQSRSDWPVWSWRSLFQGRPA